MATTNNNLAIWEQVSKTDPVFAKDFQKNNFNGTAICAQSQVLKATEIFGPFGSGWGVRNETFSQITFAGKPEYTIMQYQAEFWYRSKNHLGKSAVMTFPISADIEMFQVYNGVATRTTDATKKVSTDALTKGLSRLGFNADIFLGQFVGNKYIVDKNAQVVDIEKVKEAAKKPKISQKQFETVLKRINLGDTAVYEKTCGAFDLTQVEKSVLFESHKVVESKKHANGTTTQ